MSTSADLKSRDTNKQDYGNDPLKVRDTDHYQNEYIRGFVEKWDELIDWEGRAASEGQFFVDVLKKYGKAKILDVATGTGFHSIRLKKAGLDVTSCDGSAQMLAMAFDNGVKHDQILKTVCSDWRWLNKDIQGKYDAVICLGNSFTHLHEEADRRRALAEFYAALKHDGVLIMDHRNYDAILDGNYGSKHSVYTGKDVNVFPEKVDDGLARFCYEFSDGQTYHLNMFPLRRNYVEGLMTDAGFQNIETYGDFNDKPVDNPDFFIHVAQKKFDHGKS